MPSVAVDDIIESNQLPEPVKVVMVQPDGKGLRIMGAGVNTNQFYDRVFDADQFTVRRVTFAADGERFRLAALADRIRAAAQFDPHFAIGVSQIDPLPHQIDAVYNHLLRAPRIRFLLADDPGAGKTIMAGLLLKELQHRGVVERVLVVAPANLTMQWQDEMQLRFGEEFAVIRSSELKAHPNGTVWNKYQRTVISIDLARRPDVRASFEGVRWDLVIVDEAHKMSAYQYGEKVEKRQAYQLGEDLSQRTDHLLLMTATPHRGNVDNFRLLLSLLDPDLFQSNASLAGILKQQRMPIFLRRLKEHMCDFDGKPLFPPRHVETVRYTLAGKELELYDAVTDYVVERFARAENVADDRTRRNVALALMVLQRRLASSLRAIRKSLERREEKLRQQLHELRTNPAGVKAPVLATLNIRALDDEPDDEPERWEQEDAALGMTAPGTVREFELEIGEVHRLYELAAAAEHEAEFNDSERKLSELRKVLKNPLDDGRNAWESGEKLLVFTENRDTLDYLSERFLAWGFRIAQIYGGMDQETRRQQQGYFKDPNGAQIMVATEAAGEGINLQFCRLMVNYDIPWNPNRLEQRMGRIHRYGQRYSVRIFNLVADNTREGEVLDKVLDKIERMRTDLGSDKVYDIIGDLFSSTDLQGLVRNAIQERQSLDEIRMAVEHTIDANEKRRKAQAALADMLATDIMQPAALDELQEHMRAANEQRLVPEYIEQFVVRAFGALCSDKGYRTSIQRRRNEPGVWTIESVPHFMRSAAPSGFSIKSSYLRIVFAKILQEQNPTAEFVAPGHPLFEALLMLVRNTYGKLLTEGARFAASPSEQGIFWLWEATMKDGTGAIAGQKLVGIHQALDGTLTQRDPLALLDVEPAPPPLQGDTTPLLSEHLQALVARPKDAEVWNKTHIVEPYLDELRIRRRHEANVRETYLNQSLNHLIDDQETKILVFAENDRARRQDSTAYNIGLHTLESRLEELKTRLAHRMDESTHLREVGADQPRLVGVCAYVEAPLALLDDAEDDDPDTERVAVATAMTYERAHDRDAKSVEASNLGFDLRSRGPREVRYIEVKGRKGTGPIMLTANEWIKAARFGAEYWLYVVYNCATANPRLVIIQDPARHLTVAENTFQEVRFRVNAGEVLRVGSEE